MKSAAPSQGQRSLVAVLAGLLLLPARIGILWIVIPTPHPHAPVARPQTQQRQYPYREHFERVASAVALPAGASALQWLLLWLLGTFDQRVSRRIKALQDTKRAMIKELKVGVGAC
jgi:hypothetical protein